MANLKISQLSAGNPAQAGDLIPIDRAGSNFSITAGSIAALATSVAWANLTGDLTETQVVPWDGPTPGTKDTGISRLSAGSLAIGNGTQGDASGLLQLNGIGIGTSASTGKFLMDGTISDLDPEQFHLFSTFTNRSSSVTVQAYFNPSYIPDGNVLSGTTFIGVHCDLSLLTGVAFNSNADSNIAGLFQAFHFGTGQVTNLMGLFGGAFIESSGGVTNNYGLSFSSGSQATGTVTNDYTCYLRSPQTTGPLTHHYGLYIADQTTGGANNPNPFAMYVVKGISHFGDTVEVVSGSVLEWNADSGISRLSAASLAIGNGTGGDKTGALSLTTLNVIASGSAPTSLGTAGTFGQIISNGSNLYFCSVAGGAGSATWNKINLTAV